MCADDVIPDRVTRAFELLLRERQDVAISMPLHRAQGSDGTVTVFECSLIVPENVQGIPESISVRVVLDDAFPYTPVLVYPLCDEVRGFPHQDAWTGKLCLKEERLAPISEERLVTYIKWTEDWLADAAEDRLLPAGHPYELPDFSVKGDEKEPEFKYPGLLLFHETNKHYDDWRPRIGSTGTVELAVRCLPTALVAVEFRATTGEVVRRAGFSDAYLGKCKRITGRWALVEDIRFFRNRPPQTFEELAEMLGWHVEDIDVFFRKAWKDGSKEIAVVLLGWPVPKYVGGTPIRVHWRAMVFRSYEYYCRNMSKGHSRKHTIALKVWPDMKKRALKMLPWIDGENLAAEDLHARWQLSASFRQMYVGMIGCGAVGSLVAEILVRGGVERLHFFDGDTLRYGNLSRHTLGGWDVDGGKAVKLALRAQNINPLARIAGHGVKIPLVGKSEVQQKAEVSLGECGLLIDCSTSNEAGTWLSEKARRERKRMVMMFIDYRAEHLTLCVAGRNTKCTKVEQGLYADVRQGLTPVERAVYFSVPSGDELCIPSPGCWHPTFPAALMDIQALVACAVRELDRYISQPEQCSGVGLVLRRNTGELDETRSLITLVWRREYR